MSNKLWPMLVTLTFVGFALPSAAAQAGPEQQDPLGDCEGDIDAVCRDPNGGVCAVYLSGCQHGVGGSCGAVGVLCNDGSSTCLIYADGTCFGI